MAIASISGTPRGTGKRGYARIGRFGRCVAPLLRGGGQIVVVVMTLIVVVGIVVGSWRGVVRSYAVGTEGSKVSGIDHVDEITRVDPACNVREPLCIDVPTHLRRLFIEEIDVILRESLMQPRDRDSMRSL